ncbi:hypothetical protein BDK51DRAFT_42544 [Blyttiomyces helicus]|uniref:Uncharacterized protein n=1 Tax=Blyttiomyces helicus TaxID=388810 RepID=A0A4P9WUJ2_9FUNG|nr:hypothetical protein BDK51DRAFT_42544 [Blyttiomyces helicus]|eukprot:RKO94776.1 hypothetical protein BDK51DRAFT_42544 [Blyttiomyces helicus]
MARATDEAASEATLGGPSRRVPAGDAPEIDGFFVDAGPFFQKREWVGQDNVGEVLSVCDFVKGRGMAAKMHATGTPLRITSARDDDLVCSVQTIVHVLAEGGRAEGSRGGWKEVSDADKVDADLDVGVVAERSTDKPSGISTSAGQQRDDDLVCRMQTIVAQTEVLLPGGSGASCIAPTICNPVTEGDLMCSGQMVGTATAQAARPAETALGRHWPAGVMVTLPRTVDPGDAFICGARAEGFEEGIEPVKARWQSSQKPDQQSGQRPYWQKAPQSSLSQRSSIRKSKRKISKKSSTRTISPKTGAQNVGFLFFLAIVLVVLASMAEVMVLAFAIYLPFKNLAIRMCRPTKREIERHSLRLLVTAIDSSSNPLLNSPLLYSTRPKEHPEGQFTEVGFLALIIESISVRNYVEAEEEFTTTPTGDFGIPLDRIVNNPDLSGREYEGEQKSIKAVGDEEMNTASNYPNAAFSPGCDFVLPQIRGGIKKSEKLRAISRAPVNVVAARQKKQANRPPPPGFEARQPAEFSRQPPWSPLPRPGSIEIPNELGIEFNVALQTFFTLKIVSVVALRIDPTYPSHHLVFPAYAEARLPVAGITPSPSAFRPCVPQRAVGNLSFFLSISHSVAFSSNPYVFPNRGGLANQCEPATQFRNTTQHAEHNPDPRTHGTVAPLEVGKKLWKLIDASGSAPGEAQYEMRAASPEPWEGEGDKLAWGEFEELENARGAVEADAASDTDSGDSASTRLLETGMAVSPRLKTRSPAPPTAADLPAEHREAAHPASLNPWDAGVDNGVDLPDPWEGEEVGDDGGWAEFEEIQNARRAATDAASFTDSDGTTDMPEPPRVEAPSPVPAVQEMTPNAGANRPESPNPWDAEPADGETWDCVMGFVPENHATEGAPIIPAAPRDADDGAEEHRVEDVPPAQPEGLPIYATEVEPAEPEEVDFELDPDALRPFAVDEEGVDISERVQIDGWLFIGPCNVNTSHGGSICFHECYYAGQIEAVKMLAHQNPY